jgi:hypothetical protein
MTCVAFLDRLRFVSGADEKVVRVFDAPKGFADSLKQLGVTKDDLGAVGCDRDAPPPVFHGIDLANLPFSERQVCWCQRTAARIVKSSSW